MYLTQTNMQEVLESSMQKPLFCLFHTQTPDCQPAINTINAVISETNEFVTPVLCDLADPGVQFLASRMGLRVMPTLVVVTQGAPAAMVEGSQEIIDNIQETLNQFMPNEQEMLVREALEAEANQDLNTAVAKAAAAYKIDSSKMDYKFIYVRLLIANKQAALARQLLDAAGREEQSQPQYQQLLSALSLLEQSQNSPELLDLEKNYEENPTDETAVALAIAYSEAGKKEEALALLFARLKEDLSREEVKKTFLDILSTMDGDKLQSTYRRRLYTLMY